MPVDALKPQTERLFVLLDDAGTRENCREWTEQDAPDAAGLARLRGMAEGGAARARQGCGFSR